VNLHRVPDVQSTEIAGRQPPETRGPKRAAQRPIGGGPIGIDNIRYRLDGGRRRRVSIRLQADVFGAFVQQQVDWREHHQDQDAHRGTCRSPSALLDQVLDPWQQRHRADADSGKGQPHREATPAIEPVGQEQRLTGVAETDAARADHDPDGEIEMPWLRRQRRQQHAACHQRDAKLHHRPRAGAIHQAADQRTDYPGDQKSERERARGDAAFPSELVDDRGKEERKTGTRVHPDRHRDECDHDDDPAVKERKPHHEPLRSANRMTSDQDESEHDLIAFT
jgi:hypothetical protein